MTQHLHRQSKLYGLGVSDRLLSGGLKDPLANKNVIYFARDAVVSIGYTGLAYELSPNRNTPTDEWIAEVLCGEPIPRGPDGVRPVAMNGRKIRNWLDIGQSVELLCETLGKSLQRLALDRRRLRFEMVVAGWQITHGKRFEPVLVEILKAPGDGSPVRVERTHRHEFLAGKFALAARPETYLSTSELSELLDEVSNASPSEAETAFLKTIRDVSAKNPKLVGPHCISIFLPRPGTAPIRVRFLPATLHTAKLKSLTQKTEVTIPVAFAPWIVGPYAVHAAAVCVGVSNWTFRVPHLGLGGYEVVLEGPTPPSGPLGYLGAQPRPSAP